MAKNLIIYYSRRGQNYVNGSIKNLAKGNAELITGFLAKAVGADVFEVDTVKPYSENYTTCTEEAKIELREKARPELKEYLDSVAEYDNIFVVGPNWWGMSYNKDKSEETQYLQGVQDWFSPYYFAA